MLGLSKKEITRQVRRDRPFAELEEFIDAPVKTYSSGMYMRLGFSIAINVNPEILLIDEVLAVGDAAFVPKCLDRIDDFRRRKKTILFVSHDLATVAKICDRVAWMKSGRIQMLGEPKRVVDAYLQDVADKQEEDFERAPAGRRPAGAAATEEERRENRWGKREIEIRKVTLKNLAGEEKHVFHSRRGHVIEMDVAAREPVRRFRLRHRHLQLPGHFLLWDEHPARGFRARLHQGEGKVACRIETAEPDQRHLLSRCRRPQARRLSLRLSPEPVFVPGLLDATGRGHRPPGPRLELLAERSGSSRRQSIGRMKGKRSEKSIGLEELVPVRRRLKRQGKTVVFTNGCFDLLHGGHIHLFQEAKKLGDVLIVALNSDASVRRLKGPSRPDLSACGSGSRSWPRSRTSIT